MQKIFSLLLAVLFACSTSSARTSAKEETACIILSPHNERQNLEGWGVSLSWWANMCGQWSEEQTNQLIDWLVSPDGLNYNIFRFNIPGGEDPDYRFCEAHHIAKGKGTRAELKGYKATESASYNWGADLAQRKLLLKIKERRPDAIFEAFCNTPPYFMTYSGCAAGATCATDDNLRTDKYNAYARYLIDVCQHFYYSHGIVFNTLEPFNEPMSNYWQAGGSQEGCHFNRSTMINFIKVLAPLLRRSGLQTQLAVTDETSVEESIKDYQAFRLDTLAFNTISRWNVHTYQADSTTRAQLQQLTSADKMPLWVSETGLNGKGLKGNLQLTQRLFDDMRTLQAQAWCDWQAVEENNDQWCTVTGNFSTAEAMRNKNYYVRKQVTAFIKQGYRFVHTPSAQMLAAVSPTRRELVIVNINANNTERTVNVDFSRYNNLKGIVRAFITDETRNCTTFVAPKAKGGKITYLLPANSIQTLVIQ